MLSLTSLRVELNIPTSKRNKIDNLLGFLSCCKLKDDTLKLPKIGDVYCKVSRQPEGALKSVTVSVNPSGEYLAACLYDNGKDLPKKSTEGKAIGLDVGLTHYGSRIKFGQNHIRAAI